MNGYMLEERAPSEVLLIYVFGFFIVCMLLLLAFVTIFQQQDEGPARHYLLTAS